MQLRFFELYDNGIIKYSIKTDASKIPKGVLCLNKNTKI